MDRLKRIFSGRKNIKKAPGQRHLVVLGDNEVGLTKSQRVLGADAPPKGVGKPAKFLFGRRFGSGPTAYQNKVNALTGALGPASSAFWANTLKTTGPAYSLGAQPLYYAPAQGFYVTSADVPAAQGSVNFSSFGFGRRRRSRRSRRGKVSKKASKRRSRRRRSRKNRR